MILPSRRLRASVTAATWVVCGLVLPLAHLAGHRADHVHGPGGLVHLTPAANDPATLDVTRFLDADGHADLAALARALEGHDDASHDTGTPLDHALGAAEHFGLLLPGLAPVLAAPLATPVALGTSDDGRAPDAPPIRADFLSTQRAQAPPA